MKFFVIAALVACASASPVWLAGKPYVNEGVPTGPLTPAFGDAVATPRGLRPLSLEGFSEDLNQDGYVDPIAQAAVAPIVAPIAAPAISYAAAPAFAYAAAPAFAPLPLAAPVLKAAEIKPVEVKKIELPTITSYAAAAPLPVPAFTTTYAAAPIATYAAPAPVWTGPRFAQQALLTPGLVTAGSPFLGAPVIAAAAPAVAEEKPVEADAVIEA